GSPNAPAESQPKPVDPALVKAGYKKAIELSPRAAEQMELAKKSLKQNEQLAAYPRAEGARKILEEIEKAQPRQDQPEEKQKDEDKKNENQKKHDEQEKQKNEQQKKDQQKDDRQKKEEQKRDQQKKQEEEKKSQEQSKSEEPKK